MKKIILGLITVCLSICTLIFVACETKNSEDIREATGLEIFTTTTFESGDDLAKAIHDYYTGSDEQNNAIQNNQSIKNFIYDSTLNRFIQTLYDNNISPSTINSLYNLVSDGINPNRVIITHSGQSVPFFLLVNPPSRSEFESEISLYLKNPDSLQIHSISLYLRNLDWTSMGNAFSGDFLLFVVDYSAQNGFGGTNREEAYGYYKQNNIKNINFESPSSTVLSKFIYYGSV